MIVTRHIPYVTVNVLQIVKRGKQRTGGRTNITTRDVDGFRANKFLAENMRVLGPITTFPGTPLRPDALLRYAWSYSMARDAKLRQGEGKLAERQKTRGQAMRTQLRGPIRLEVTPPTPPREVSALRRDTRRYSMPSNSLTASTTASVTVLLAAGSRAAMAVSDAAV